MNEPRRNRFHSLCPYFAMFPESFAETWLARFSKPGDYVLDPFCGRGTTPFQALLMGRKAIACDVNPVAYCVTRAKTDIPAIAAVRRRISILERQYRASEWEKGRSSLPDFFRVAYTPKTLGQILYLRKRLEWRRTKTDCMLAALVLGSLHGESSKSPSYLSNQMPHTISTKPDYSVRFWKKRGLTPPERNAFELLRKMARFRYESSAPEGTAHVFRSDMRDLPERVSGLCESIKLVITSPPYLDVTNFEEDQWLRLWFLGGEPFSNPGRFSRDDRHQSPEVYWRFVADMWRILGRILGANARIVIRLGATRIQPDDLSKMLAASALFSGRKMQLLSTEVSEIRKKQTDSFSAGSKGCKVEVDCCFRMS